jgi:hypothetical protein
MVGHVIKIDQTRMATTFLSKPEGGRKVGRPRLGWQEYEENDLRELRAKRCQRKTGHQSRRTVERKSEIAAFSRDGEH